MDCKHDLKRPYAGMHVSEVMADVVVFECAGCGARHEAYRCAATAKTTGKRCSLAAFTSSSTCRKHRRLEESGLLGEEATS